MLLLLCVILCAFIAFYLYAKKCNNYWQERGVTTAKTNFFFGTMYDLLVRGLSMEQIHEPIYWSKPDEPYVGFYNALKPMLFVRDPELIHQITVKDFSHFHDRLEYHDGLGRLNEHLFVLGGEQWKSVRNKLVPTFSANKLKRMYDLIEECAEMVVEHHFRPLAKAGKPVDVKETTERFSLDVIGKCAFGMQFNSLHESDSLYREMGQAFSNTGFINLLKGGLLTIHPKVMKYLGLKVASNDVENFFLNLLYRAEELRSKELKHRDDMLQLMLDMKLEDKLTENHVVSNMFAFYTAGHEPTSHTIAFALHELSLNPEIQERLRTEIRKAREANDGVLDYTTIKKIEYLEMIVAETLRLHGTAPFQSRICTKAYKIPGSSLELNVGQQVFYLTSALHKNKKYFPNPLKFDPERFSPENIAQMNPHVYLPWGTGPRKCIGIRFAKLEIKICLAAILSHFKVSRSDRTEVPIVLRKRSFFHSPENAVWLTFEEIDCKNT